MKVKSWHLVAFISCAVWLAYYPALSAPLNPVDDARLANDLLNRLAFSWEDFWFPNSKSYFRPLVNSSFILDHLIWGFGSSFLHLENILLHWLNTLLVYFIARQASFAQGYDQKYLAATAALIFAIHPINSEAVIWVAGRADLLATTFVLLALLLTFHYFGKQKLLWLLGVVITFFLGTLAKETAIMLVPGLFALGWVAFKNNRVPRLSLLHAWLPALMSTLTLGVYAFLRAHALRGADLGVRHVVQIASEPLSATQTEQQLVETSSYWVSIIETTVTGIGFYARKLFQPFPLNFGIVSVEDIYFWPGCIVVLLFLIIVMRLNWWSSFVVTAMSLASVALVVPLGDISWTPYAERYMYAPTAMLSLGVTLGYDQLRCRFNLDGLKGALTATLVAVLLSYCAVTVFQRSLIWQDNLTLFSDTVEKSPDFALANHQLAQELLQHGRKEEALSIMRRVEMPMSQMAYLNKSYVMIEDGDLIGARKFLLESLDLEETKGYRKAILENLVQVVEIQQRNSGSLTQSLRFNKEIMGYLNQLWLRTGDPFYLYQLGYRQLEYGDSVAARDSFTLAYEKLPPESIYRQPTKKILERLSKE